MIKAILKKVAPVPKLESFDSYLFVSPHPDDSEVGCGATIAKLTAAGKKVYILVATDGCVGSVIPQLSGEKLIGIRREEVLAAGKITGVPQQNIFFLDFADGGDYDEAQMRYEIARHIVRLRPDVVLTPDYTVPTECHIDHLNVGRQTTYASTCVAPFAFACERQGIVGTHTPKLIAYYYTHKPNCYINTKSTFSACTQALKCYVSQFSQNDLKLIETYRKLRAIRLGARRFCRYADGYRVLPPLHQHCFPEASEF